MIKTSFKIYIITVLSIAALYATGIKNATAQEFLVEPPCSNSKCITVEMINVAHHKAGGQHAKVAFDDMPSYVPELSHAEPCAAPRTTGVTVYQQIPGRTINFPDIFCINQGCTPFSGDAGGAPRTGGATECRH